MPKKLSSTIESENIQQQKPCKVLLIGDSCIDKYVYGEVTRLNPEAPVPVLNYKRTETRQGMAWNVYNNLRSFGIHVYMLTNEEKIVKTRYIEEKSNQQILRVDEEVEVKPLSYELPTDDYDAMVISDYNKGFITKEILFHLAFWFDGPIFIDSKKTELPADCFIKLNDIETKKINVKEYPWLITTKGSSGAIYKGKLYPGVKVPVFDVAGAGDTFLAGLVYGYLKYGGIEKAIPLANKSAAIAVSNPGTYVLTQQDIAELL